MTAEIAPRPALGLGVLVERESRRRRRQHVLVWILLAALPIVALAAWLALRPRPVPMAARFRTQNVMRGDVVRTVRATGHVEAIETVTVGAEVSGRIATVHVDYNDRVTRGQVLARFDRTSFAAQVAQSQALLEAARFAAEQATLDRDKTHRDRLRSDALFASGSIGAAEHDATTTAAALAEQRLAAARTQVAAQRAAFDVAKTNLDHAVIYSPIDGVIITRNVDPGQTVASMLMTPVLFTVAADLSKMRVIAAVDEADIGETKEGQRATFGVTAYPDRTFEGLVTEVRNAPQVVQDVVTYGVVIQVANDDFALKPGMTASVRVVTAKRDATLRVPAASLELAIPGESRGQGAGVWVLDGAPKFVPVKPGVSDGETTAIDDGALAEGAPVLVELTPAGRKAYGVAR